MAVLLIATLPAGDVLVAHIGLTQPKSLYRINLATKQCQLVFRRSRTDRPDGARPSHVMVTATSSLTIPIDVWRARTQPSQGVIIKFPTTRGWYPTYYSGTDQYLISKGYDVIAFDFQPKLPGQPGWDLAITADDVTAALAVINYARITLGARPDKIVLSGESNGTLFVARTAARMECKLGGIVLQGVGGRMKDLNNVRNHKFSVALLQGEYDRLSPLEAKEAVEIIFGADIFKKPNGLWVGLKNEGHVPRLLLSRASIAAAAYSAIRAP